MTHKILGLFSIVILLGLTSCKDGIYSECSQYKNGKFELIFENVNAPKSIVYRNDRTQIEITPSGDSVINKVDWIDECTYNLHVTSAPASMQLLQKPIETKIVGINPDGYDFVATILDTTQIVLKGKAVALKD